MNAKPSARIEGVVRQALGMAAGDERDAFLRTACAGDDALRREVECLLAGQGAPGIVPGSSLAHYRIEAKIGQGGMGAVYRAFDTRLQRQVALKVLTHTSATDEESRHRFTREARAASALNHPNIVTIHDIGSADGVEFIAMEYVQGRPLDEFIVPKGMPVAQLLRYAIQIADALARAHAARILHRDIKPSNLMVTEDGRIKVLDFGLAKPMVEDTAEDAETKTLVTKQGVVVGTASYMSPEQAEGRPVDARSDIFSFGCVLYEMATGRRPFHGDSAVTVMYKISHEDPQRPSDIVPVAAELEALILRCLRRDPARRFQTMDDLKSALEDLQIESSSSRAVPAQAPSRTRRMVVAAAVAVVLAVTGWLAFRSLQGPREVVGGRTVKFSITPGNLVRGGLGEIDTEVSVSRDGKHIAYVDTQDGQLWIRDIDQEQARPVNGATAVYQVFWSPDNQHIGYSAGRNCGGRPGCDLMRIPVQGGTPRQIVKLKGPFRRAFWSSDGRTIVYCDTTGMYTVPAEGGQVARVLDHRHIEHPSTLDLPGGRRAYLYQSLEPGQQGPGHGIWVRVAGEDRSRLIKMTASNNPYPAYSPTGHIVYVDGPLNSPGIWALPFSISTLSAAGEAFPIAQRGSSPMVSATGTLVYSDVPSNLFQLAWLDRTGTNLSTLGEPQQQFAPRLSPDGRRLAIEIVQEGFDLWVYDLDRGIKTRLTFDPARESPGGWTPSGDRITYDAGAGGKPGMYWRASNGNGEAELLLASPLRERSPEWSPDQRFLMYVASTPETQADLLFRERRSDGTLGEAVVFLKTPFNEGQARFSPDGRFVAYVSDESGKDEVYVRDFPEGKNKWQISANGGGPPRWRRDGEEIFYAEHSRLMAVRISRGGEFRPGTPAMLFEKPSQHALQFDVSPDGKKFIVLLKPSAEPPLAIHVAHNWFEEFRARRGAPDR